MPHRITYSSKWPRGRNSQTAWMVPEADTLPRATSEKVRRNNQTKSPTSGRCCLNPSDSCSIVGSTQMLSYLFGTLVSLLGRKALRWSATLAPSRVADRPEALEAGEKARIGVCVLWWTDSRGPIGDQGANHELTVARPSTAPKVGTRTTLMALVQALKALKIAPEGVPGALQPQETAPPRRALHSSESVPRMGHSVATQILARVCESAWHDAMDLFPGGGDVRTSMAVKRCAGAPKRDDGRFETSEASADSDPGSDTKQLIRCRIREEHGCICLLGASPPDGQPPLCGSWPEMASAARARVACRLPPRQRARRGGGTCPHRGRA